MIPKIDVRRSVARKKYEGELSFEYSADGSLIDIPFVGFSSPVKADLRYEIFEDDSVEVTGTVTFSMKGGCSRCLGETEQTFTGEVDGLFVKNGDEDEDFVYSDMVDLTDLLRESVLFALPSKFLCGECLSDGDE